MTTPEQRRCRKCSYLEQHEDGRWICLDAEQDIQEITDEDCPLEQDW